MRITKWSPGNEGLFEIEQAGDAVDLGRLDRFIERRRDNGRDAFCQHRFPRTWGADHQNIMSAGDGYFDRAFDVRLAFHVVEIEIVALVHSEKVAQISAGRQK